MRKIYATVNKEKIFLFLPIPARLLARSVICVCAAKGRCKHMKILENLWRNGLYPNDQEMTHTKRFLKLVDLSAANEKDLVAIISDEAKRIFEKYKAAQSELNDLQLCEEFIYGFRLGARITFEVMDGWDIPHIDEI